MEHSDASTSETCQGTAATWSSGDEGALPLPDGTRIAGRYELREPVGRGSFSVVYSAWDPILRRQVALKLYRPGVGSPISQQEVALQSAAQHPNLMPLYDAGTDPALGLPYVAMPLYPGADLGAVLAREGPQPIKRSLLVADQLCSAVDFLWRRRRAIHGDIKPANIWCTEDGTAVLMDFNLRGCAAAGLDVPGTPGYTAPEVLEGRRDPRSDVFSLGCVLYHLLTGRPPFADHGEVLSKTPPPPSSLRAELFHWTDEVIMTALARDPEERFESAFHLRSALRHGHLQYAPGLLGSLARWTSIHSQAGRLVLLTLALGLLCLVGYLVPPSPDAPWKSLRVSLAVILPWLGALALASGRRGRRRDPDSAACALLAPGCDWAGPLAQLALAATILQLVALFTVWAPLTHGQPGWGQPWGLALAAAGWAGAARLGFHVCRRPRRGPSLSALGFVLGVACVGLVLVGRGEAWLLAAAPAGLATLLGGPTGVALGVVTTAARAYLGSWSLPRAWLELAVVSAACGLASQSGPGRWLRAAAGALAPTILGVFLGEPGQVLSINVLLTALIVGVLGQCRAVVGRLFRFWRAGR